MDNVGDLFNEVYYIYKDTYNEEINGLNTKDTKKFNCKQLRLTDDYQHESEEEREQTSRNMMKKKPPKKLTKTDVRGLNESIVKEETGMKKKMF